MNKTKKRLKLFDLYVRAVIEEVPGACSGCIFDKNEYKDKKDNSCTVEFPINMDKSATCGYGNNIIYKPSLTSILNSL